MKIELKKFGNILTSRPARKEAAQVIRAYLAPKNSRESIELDFSGVGVEGPSWLEEVLVELRKEY